MSPELYFFLTSSITVSTNEPPTNNQLILNLIEYMNGINGRIATQKSDTIGTRRTSINSDLSILQLHTLFWYIRCSTRNDIKNKLVSK